MARVIIRPQEQYERIEKLRSKMQEFEKIPVETLTKRPHEKAWSPIEVAAHMAIAYDAYIPKVENALSKIKSAGAPWNELQTRSIPSFAMKKILPSGDKVKFKIKTFKSFKPVLEPKNMGEADVKKVFDHYYSSLDHMKNSIDEYKAKEADSYIFNSAAGFTLRFNVAEAVHFTICHNERHTQQMTNTLKKLETVD